MCKSQVTVVKTKQAGLKSSQVQKSHRLLQFPMLMLSIFYAFLDLLHISNLTWVNIAIYIS